jgi:hypothetical protein
LIFHGRVVNDKGEPVPNALVEPFGYSKGDFAQYGGLKDIDPLALTNDKGKFRLAIPEKGIGLYVLVSAGGFANRAFSKVTTDMPHDLELNNGVTVTGRVLKNGQPLAGAAIGLVQQNRSADHFTGDYKVATDSKGVFTILNVPANDAFYSYGLMDSLKAHGALSVRILSTKANDTKTAVGDLNVEPGYRLSGRLTLSDGKLILAGTRVLMSREDAWDNQQALVDKDGSFSFTGLPAEHYSLSANIKGYRVSSKNASFDVINPFRLLGTVKADITDLRLLYEPGEAEFSGSSDPKVHEEYQRRRDKPLQGAPEPDAKVQPAPLGK